MTSRTALPACLALVAACSPEAPLQAEVSAAPIDRPSVVLITIDTTRADHLGCYGYAGGTSPHLDRLAERGARFDLCISTASVTPVSHASIFTGMNPYRHGLRVMYAATGYELPEGTPTLATELGARGWTTAAFVSAFTVSRLFGLDRGFSVYDDEFGGEVRAEFTETEPGRAFWDIKNLQRRSDDTTDRALAWIADATEPYFLWVHYWDPHDAGMVPPKPVIRKFLDRGGDEQTALYDAEIHFTDRQVGRLLEAIDTGPAGDTIVVVTADHGQGLGEHDWHAHRILYQEQIHLPLLIAGPGIPEGVVVPDLVRSIDLVPTVLELVGATPDPRVEGASLMPLIEGVETTGRLAYADQLNRWDANASMLAHRPGDDLLHVLMDARWKLIYRPFAPADSELYDLERDPEESLNLYAQETEQAERLLAELERRNPFVLEGLGEGDADLLPALEGLGYVDGE